MTPVYLFVKHYTRLAAFGLADLVRSQERSLHISLATYKHLEKVIENVYADAMNEVFVLSCVAGFLTQ